MEVESGCNLHTPIIQVLHSQLIPLENPKKYARQCPVCLEGILGVTRDSETYVIKDFDNCLFCEQHFQYLDADQLREKDWAK